MNGMKLGRGWGGKGSGARERGLVSCVRACPSCSWGTMQATQGKGSNSLVKGGGGQDSNHSYRGNPNTQAALGSGRSTQTPTRTHAHTQLRQPSTVHTYSARCARVCACGQESAEGLEVAMFSGKVGGSEATLPQKWRRGTAGSVWGGPCPPSPAHTKFDSSVDPPASKAACSAGKSPALAASKTAPSLAEAWL